MDKSSSIGVFDSGIGGLTLAHAINEILPNEKLFYFGDTAHLPYGDKSTAAIQAYSIKICNVLLQQGVKAIVIACNSASSAAYDLVKEYVGSRAEVINVIDPVVGHVAMNYASSNVGLIGTRRTVRSNIYKTKIDALGKEIDLKSLATPLLATMIEEGFFDNSISEHVIAEYLSHDELDGIESLILGCTHYPLIKNQIRSYYEERVDIIDSSDIVAQRVKSILTEKDLLNPDPDPDHVFYVSDFTHSFQQSTAMFFGEEVNLQKYKLWE